MTAVYQDAAGTGADAPLGIALIVPGGPPATWEPAIRRLLPSLVADARFDLRAVLPAETGRAELSGAVGRVLSLERRLIAPPRRQPLPDLPGALPILDHVPARPLDGIDVTIDLAGLPDVAAALARPRFGTWRLTSFAPGAGAAAAMTGRTTTPVALVRTAGDGGTRLLADTAYDTKDLAGLNGAYIREKSVHLLLRELARLHRDGVPADGGQAPAHSAPGGAALPGYALRGLASAGSRLRDKVRRRSGGAPKPFGLRIGRGDLSGFDPALARDVPLPAGHFWADPFLVEHSGETWCLFEDFDYATGVGNISAGRVVDSGLADVRPVMTPAHHLSFPHVFPWKGEVLMVPEAHQAGRLEIWRATRFPDAWEIFATGPEGLPMVDTVPFEVDGAWWMFTHLPVDSFGDFCNELHLFRIDGPELRRIEPHPLNPVVIGAETARGGGRVHRRDGRLFRLSQDNSGGVYGYGLNVMEITRLDPQGYEERRVRHLRPDFAPGLIGIHHFDAAGGWFVVDVRRP